MTDEQLPPDPGTAPVPEGHVRLWHYTPLHNVPAIRQKGLLREFARGDAGDGDLTDPSAGMWASTAPPHELLNTHDSAKAVVEFHAHPREISGNAESPWQAELKREPGQAWEDRRYDPDKLREWAEGNHHVIMHGDVHPSQILAVHEPWHAAARYMRNDDPTLREYQWVKHDYAQGGNDHLEPYVRGLRALEGSYIPPREYSAGRMRVSDIRRPGEGRLSERPYTQRELAADIRQHGVQQPLAIEHLPAHGGPTTFNGLHRLDAAELAGVPDVPVVVKHLPGDYPPMTERRAADETEFNAAYDLERSGRWAGEHTASVQAQAVFVPAHQYTENVRHVLDNYLPSDDEMWDGVRSNYDWEHPHLKAMVEDIRRNGVQRPVPIDYEQDPPRVMNGHTRLLAAERADRETVPTRQHAGFMDPDDPDPYGHQPGDPEHWTSKPEWQAELKEQYGPKDSPSNDYKDSREAALLDHFEASGVDDYGMGHRPLRDGAPAHDLTEGYAEDIYTHPQYWAGEWPERGAQEGLKQLRDARGNPEHPVTIYRASPPGAPYKMHTGDWVSLSPSYAKLHAYNEGDDEWHVHKAVVPAKHVRDAGTDQYREQGYWGPDIDTEHHSGPRPVTASAHQGASSDDYGILHRPDVGGPPLHDLTDSSDTDWGMPKDIYERMHEYNTYSHDPGLLGEAAYKAMGKIRKFRGQPEKKVRIWRSAPAVNPESRNGKRGEINHGDWVGLSREKALSESYEVNDPPHGSLPANHPQRYHIWSALVPAKHVRNADGDLTEWGYAGPDIKDIPHHSETCSHRARVKPREASMDKQAAGETAPEGHQIWAVPAEGRSPVAAEVYHNMTHREPEDEHGSAWYRGVSYHGPYHVIRHPQTRQVWLVDRHGRDASPTGGHYGNPEKDGNWGEQQAWSHQFGLESAGPEAHRFGTPDEPKLNEMDKRVPEFPHSRVDPEDEERVRRPAPRVHAPEGHSPSDEYHGSYEVVQHPETGRYHVVDNAGRSAHVLPLNGFGSQLQAERSRDYTEKSQRSKEIGRGVADAISRGGMEALDPGGTEESRQSDENLRTGSELMTRYEGGLGEIKFDSDEEGGAPYYEREHLLGGTRPSGWYAKHYGGAHTDVYHRATGDESHALLHLPQHPEDENRSMTPRLHPHFGDEHLAGTLAHWHDDPENTTRSYLEQTDPRIQRWRRRHLGSVPEVVAHFEEPAPVSSGHPKEAAVAALVNPHNAAGEDHFKGHWAGGGRETWYHGSPYAYHHMDPGQAMDQESLMDMDEPSHTHWNNLLGAHFAGHEGTAANFIGSSSSGNYEGPGGYIYHARLHLRNPKHYDSEFSMDREAYGHEFDQGNHPVNHDEFFEEEHEGDPNLSHHEDLRQQEDYPSHVHPITGQPSRYDNRGRYMRWLSQHPDKEGIARRFKERTEAAGHDGITYGNELEQNNGGNGGTCAIAFHPHQIQITQRHEYSPQREAEGEYEDDNPYNCKRGEAAEHAEKYWPSHDQPALPFGEHQAALEPEPQGPRVPSFTWQYETYGPQGGYVSKEQEVSGPFYHGGRSKRMRPGGQLRAGMPTNSWGDEGPRSKYIHFTTDLTGARDYAREAGGHVYEVEPTGKVTSGYIGAEWKSEHPLNVIRRVPDDEEGPAMHTASAGDPDAIEVVAHFGAPGHFEFYHGEGSEDGPRTSALEEHLHGHGGDLGHHYRLSDDVGHAWDEAYNTDPRSQRASRYHQALEGIHQGEHARMLQNAQEAVRHGASPGHPAEVQAQLEGEHHQQWRDEEAARFEHEHDVAHHLEMGSAHMHGQNVSFPTMIHHLTEEHGIPSDALPEHRLPDSDYHDPYQADLEQAHNESHGEMGNYAHDPEFGEGSHIEMHGRPLARWDAEHHLVNHHGFDLDDLRRDEPSMRELGEQHAENHTRDRRFLSHNSYDRMDEDHHLPDHHNYQHPDDEEDDPEHHFDVHSLDEQGGPVVRRYHAEDEDHAQEQHEDAFPEEEFVRAQRAPYAGRLQTHTQEPGAEPDYHDTAHSWTPAEYRKPPRSREDLWAHLQEHHGVTQSADSTKEPGQSFMIGLHDRFHMGELPDRGTPHQHDLPEGHDPVFGSAGARALVAHFGERGPAVPDRTARDTALAERGIFGPVLEAIGAWQPQGPAELAEVCGALREGLQHVARYLEELPLDPEVGEAVHEVVKAASALEQDFPRIARMLPTEASWETPGSSPNR